LCIELLKINIKKSELRQLIKEEIQSFRESQQSETYYTLFIKEMDPDNLSTVRGFELVQD